MKTKDEHWRLFIALPVDDAIKTEIFKYQQQVKKRLSSTRKHINFVNPAGIHITLKFLGNTPVRQIEQIKSEIKLATQQFDEMQLSAAGCGVFPSPAAPKVLWAGIHGEGSEILPDLAKSIDKACQRCGFKREKRRFSPHITIARMKNFSIREYQLINPNPETPHFGNWVANEIVLFRSILTPSGAKYSKVNSWSLTKL